MEIKINAYHEARGTTARLESLEGFVKNQQKTQMGMQRQQDGFLKQQSIAMQQVLQQMAKRTTEEPQIKQIKQTTQIKQITQIKQTTQLKQIKQTTKIKQKNE